MLNQIEKELLEKFKDVKLEKVENHSLTFHIVGPIFHWINFSAKQVGHFIKSYVLLSWLPTLKDLELLALYFKFLRALCEVTNFPTEKTKELKIHLSKVGKTSVVEV